MVLVIVIYCRYRWLKCKPLGCVLDSPGSYSDGDGMGLFLYFVLSTLALRSTQSPIK